MILKTTVDQYSSFILMMAIFSGIFSFLAFVLPLTGPTSKPDPYRGLNRLGWWTIGCGLAGLLLLILQSQMTKWKEDQIDLDNIAEINRRDSVGKLNLIKATSEAAQKVMDNQTKAFAEYKLQYDSGTKSLTKIITDSNRVTKIFEASETTISILKPTDQYFKILNDTVGNLNVPFSSIGGTSHDLHFTIYLFASSENNISSENTTHLLTLVAKRTDSIYQIDENVPMSFWTEIKGTFSKNHKMFLLVTGNYKSNKKNLFKFKWVNQVNAGSTILNILPTGGEVSRKMEYIVRITESMSKYKNKANFDRRYY